MENIGIVTDTTSDIPKELCSKNQIELIPLYVGYDGKLFLDGIEINSDKVYKKLKSGIKVNTSGPSIGDFINLYKNLIEIKKKTLIYSIHLSSKLSSTFNTAYQARQFFPQAKIKVIDSKTSAINLGFIVLEAARAAKRNESPKKIDSLIDFMIKNNLLLATFDNFKYLFMGGRAPFLKKFLSKSIIFKPVLMIGKNGKVKLKKFARNKKSSIVELYKQVKKDRNKRKKKIGIFYGQDIGPALDLEAMVRNDPKIKIDELILTEMTTIMSAHTGPDIWGISSCPVPDEL